MAILEKCAECQRKNGYAHRADDEVCAKCSNIVAAENDKDHAKPQGKKKE